MTLKDAVIMDRVNEHYIEALEHFSEDRIVGIFLQGSQCDGKHLTVWIEVKWSNDEETDI